MVQGTVVGCIGTVIGVSFGVLIASQIDILVPLIEERLGLKIFPGEIFYISEIPSQMLFSDVTMIALVSVTLSIIATFYPAWQAARTKPAEVLRYDW